MVGPEHQQILNSDEAAFVFRASAFEPDADLKALLQPKRVRGQMGLLGEDPSPIRELA